MKTLLVLRHAKSSWKHAETSDHDRPLNKRGKRDAPRMGRLVASRGLRPDVIVSSTAKRARRTADEVARHSGYEGAVQLERHLYLASPDEIVDVVRSVAGTARRVMVVAHNPGLEDLVARLAGRPETLPTAALAEIRLAIRSWKRLELSSAGTLAGLWRPRELPDDI
jgi:phosphohistidine phosphatase